MNDTNVLPAAKTAIQAADWKNHWLGHRALTRRVIEAFPEKEFFSFSIGGMRTAAGLTKELLAIGYPGMVEISTKSIEELKETENYGDTKESFLKKWDEASESISAIWDSIPEERFKEKLIAFGQYPGEAWSLISYYIDNEIHHRGQMYVYLRALGITPPEFYDRSPYE